MNIFVRDTKRKRFVCFQAFYYTIHAQKERFEKKRRKLVYIKKATNYAKRENNHLHN